MGLSMAQEQPKTVPVDDYVRDELYPGYKPAFGSQPFVAGLVRPFSKADNRLTDLVPPRNSSRKKTHLPVR